MALTMATTHLTISTRSVTGAIAPPPSSKPTPLRFSALVFCNIDYVMLTYRLFRKDYDYLVTCLVPLGNQIQMSHGERVEMLRSKTTKLTNDHISRRFRKV
jgi:hypothetical protein